MFRKINMMFRKYHRLKEIVIYLPDDYYHTDQHYPVLYINDGQNAYFDDLSFMGVSWGFSDYAQKHHLDVIMVAIPCVFDDAERTSEYDPWKIDPKWTYEITHDDRIIGGQGDDYLDWMMNDLKPLIDHRFRTKKEATALIGSSMGGVISAYAALRYPQVFKKAVALSTPYWLNMDEWHSLCESADYDRLEGLYFDCGDLEGCGNYEEDQLYIHSNAQVYEWLKTKTDKIEYHFWMHTTHNEAEWRKRMGTYMSFLYQGKEEA